MVPSHDYQNVASRLLPTGFLTLILLVYRRLGYYRPGFSVMSLRVTVRPTMVIACGFEYGLLLPSPFMTVLRKCNAPMELKACGVSFQNISSDAYNET